MAMTKSDLLVMKALCQELAEARALRFLGIPEPTRMPLPEKGYVNGWEFNAYDWGVGKAWTALRSHGRHIHRTDDGDSYRRDISSSQGGRPIYASKLDAMIALRLAKERECAKQLGDLDQRIEAVRANSSDGDA